MKNPILSQKLLDEIFTAFCHAQGDYPSEELFSVLAKASGHTPRAIKDHYCTISSTLGYEDDPFALPEGGMA